MANTYESALEVIREATAKFYAVRDDYRAMKIGDAEFLAAKAEYNTAEAIFDAAFAEAAKA